VTFPTLEDVRAAGARLSGRVRRTPLLRCRSLDEAVGAEVWLKMESFQRTGSFKFRGATNALLQIGPEAKQAGVLTFSSGNHAQALAAAGRELGIHVVVVMPDDAPRVKREATVAYGAEVVTYQPDEEQREALGAKIAEERGLTVVPPYDHPHIVAGQGTAMLEGWEDGCRPGLVVVPCGGAGLLSGTSLVAKSLMPGCRVAGVEPEAGDDGKRSFESGILQRVSNPQTIADGARTPSLGVLTFAMVREYVDEMAVVPDEALLRACKLLWERAKCVVEPTGALAVAALMEGAVAHGGGPVLAVVSGGNADLSLGARLADA
jgi:threonine dehydratase